MAKKNNNGANLGFENRMITDEIREHWYIQTPGRVGLKPSFSGIWR